VMHSVSVGWICCKFSSIGEYLSKMMLQCYTFLIVIVSCLWCKIHSFNGTLTSAEIARVYNHDPTLTTMLTFL